MKMVILLALIFSSTSVFANGGVQFKEESFFGSFDQKTVEAAIKKSCPQYSKWPIYENMSIEVPNKETIPTAYYSTLFVVDGMDLPDEMHPATYRILVKTVQYDNSAVRVLSVVCNN